MKEEGNSRISRLLDAASTFDAWALFQDQRADEQGLKLRNPVISLDLQLIHNSRNGDLENTFWEKHQFSKIEIPDFTCPPRTYVFGRETETFLCFSTIVISDDKIMTMLSDLDDTFEIWELVDNKVVSTQIY